MTSVNAANVHPNGKAYVQNMDASHVLSLGKDSSFSGARRKMESRSGVIPLSLFRNQFYIMCDGKWIQED